MLQHVYMHIYYIFLSSSVLKQRTSADNNELLYLFVFQGRLNFSYRLNTNFFITNYIDILQFLHVQIHICN